MRRPQRTYEAIVRLLRDGAWHAFEDLRAVTQFPCEWVDELDAEGVVDVERSAGEVVLVRLR